MVPLQARYAGFSPQQGLISWAGLISVIIRCSGCFHILWHSTATDVVELTRRLLHGVCQRSVSTSCGFHALYGHGTWRGLHSRFFLKSWTEDGFNRRVAGFRGKMILWLIDQQSLIFNCLHTESTEFVLEDSKWKIFGLWLGGWRKKSDVKTSPWPLGNNGDDNDFNHQLIT